jgi:hypothetical protein
MDTPDILRSYTEKQLAYAQWLIERLGYSNVHYVNGLLRYLYGKSKKFAHLTYRSKQEIPQEYIDFYEEYNEGYIKKEMSIIDLLHEEYNIRKNQRYRKKSIVNYITATDLANYHFCPASFAIDKSMSKAPNFLAEVGKELHELKKCHRIHSYSRGKTAEKSVITDENKDLFAAIRNCRMIYGDHQKDEANQAFWNEEHQFAGKPDYVFETSGGDRIIVEEKFIYSTQDENVAYKDQHKIQLASYLSLLDNIGAREGYLVYWLYSFEYNLPRIHKCQVLKIVRDEALDTWVFRYIEKVRRFLDNSVHEFDEKYTSPKKCANCVHTMYCTHKTRKYDKVELPFHPDGGDLVFVPYPEILKDKSKESIA